MKTEPVLNPSWKEDSQGNTYSTEGYSKDSVRAVLEQIKNMVVCDSHKTGSKIFYRWEIKEYIEKVLEK